MLVDLILPEHCVPLQGSMPVLLLRGAYLYGTCSSLSCRHMSTGLLENLRKVSKWMEDSASVWLLTVAWRKGASSSAWKSMARLPLQEGSTQVWPPSNDPGHWTAPQTPPL